MMDPSADDLLSASIGRSPSNDPDPPITLPALTMLTTMAYLLTMLRSLLRQKQGHDTGVPCSPPRAHGGLPPKVRQGRPTFKKIPTYKEAGARIDWVLGAHDCCLVYVHRSALRPTSRRTQSTFAFCVCILPFYISTTHTTLVRHPSSTDGEAEHLGSTSGADTACSDRPRLYR